MEEIVYHTNYKVEDIYWWFTSRYKIIGKIIAKLTGLSNSDTVLDVGCGTGGFTKYLSNSYKMVGLDFSETALSYCRKRGLTELFKGNLSEFPKVQYKLKALTMFGVLEHIDNDSETVKQASELLDKGSWIIATVPAYMWLWSSHDEVHQHKRRYSENQSAKLFTDAGFEIKYSSYFNIFLLLPAVIKRVLDSVLKRKKTEDYSPVDEVSPFINNVFSKIFGFESKLLPTISFPFGMSIVVVAKKK